MQGKHSIVILIVSALVAASACREDNPYYCPRGRDVYPGRGVVR